MSYITGVFDYTLGSQQTALALSGATYDRMINGIIVNNFQSSGQDVLICTGDKNGVGTVISFIDINTLTNYISPITLSNVILGYLFYDKINNLLFVIGKATSDTGGASTSYACISVFETVGTITQVGSTTVYSSTGRINFYGNSSLVNPFTRNIYIYQPTNREFLSSFSGENWTLSYNTNGTLNAATPTYISQPDGATVATFDSSRDLNIFGAGEYINGYRQNFTVGLFRNDFKILNSTLTQISRKLINNTRLNSCTLDYYNNYIILNNDLTAAYYNGSNVATTVNYYFLDPITYDIVFTYYGGSPTTTLSKPIPYNNKYYFFSSLNLVYIPLIPS